MVNLKVIRKWHDALIGGEYKQGRGFLCSVVDARYEYCCLGVLCEVLDIENIMLGNPGGKKVFYGESLADKSLPHEATNLSGLDSNPVLVCGENKISGVYGCISLNDEHKYSFNQIAKCIRNTWPEAFKEEVK